MCIFRPFFRRHRTVYTLLSLILAVIVVTTVVVHAGYRVERPINNHSGGIDNGGVINQTYLWTENDHKGIDFRYNDLGDDVYAVADGEVMHVREHYDDNSVADNGFGNLILIRHTERYYISQNNGQMVGQMGYVYAIYAHLKQWSVIPNAGDTVTAGQKIAEVDDTGRSEAHHLHLQIVFDPNSNRDNGADYAWTENSSRNPELWLAPFNVDATNTATVIGKVTDTNGNAVTGLQIRGLDKPAVAEDNNPNNEFFWAQTYPGQNWANPDDIFAENFGTTDIGPGTYHVEAKYTNGALYRDLGTHTFVAGQVTYIGLHPIYQSGLTVHNASYTTASTAVRNNSDTHTANVNTTFFWSSGAVPQQETNMIAPRGSARLIPSATAFWGSAMVVSSEDVSTVVEQAYTKQVAAYSGPRPPGQGDAGWETASTNAYLPHVYNHTTWQYKSKVMIFNPGPATAEVTITYRHPNGTLVLTDGPFAVPPFAAVGKEPPGTAAVGKEPPGTTFYGSAHISANTQPVAVVADHFHNNATVNFNYNALNNGFSTIYLPYLMKNYGGWNSCFVVRNLSGSTNNIQITYYWEGGSGTYLASVPGHGTQTFCQQDLSGLPSGRVLSAQVVSTNGRNIAAAVNQSNNSAGSDQGWHMSYSGFTQPSTKVILPHVMKNASSSGRSWNSGLQIQNADAGSTTATITYYNDSGQAVYSQPIAIPAGQSRGVYLPEVSGLPNPFKGSAVVTAGRNLVAVANATCTSGCNGGDYVYTYNGFNR